MILTLNGVSGLGHFLYTVKNWIKRVYILVVRHKESALFIKGSIKCHHRSVTNGVIVSVVKHGKITSFRKDVILLKPTM